MVSVQRILDRSARDRQLRAFAYLQANYSTGAESAIDCLAPFILHAVADLENEQFDEHAIIDYIDLNYGIRMPFYMIEDMRPKLRSLGAIDNNNMANLDICRNITITQHTNDNASKIELDEIAEVGNSLSSFAHEKGVEAPFSCDTWEDALIRFFQSESKDVTTSSATVKEVIVLDSSALDNSIVSNFVLWCAARDPRKYEVIQKIYYGVLVADFITNLWATGNREQYKGLEVIYDASVLMRLLGTSGKQLQLATMELHDSLTHLGCRVFYFEHSLDELLNNIDAVLQAEKYGSHMYPETRAAINSGELTIGELNLLRTEADYRLAEIGITQHPAAYTSTRAKDQYQIDETKFVESLQSKRKTRKGRETWEKDAASLALIVRLRSGKRTRDISDSGYIFVSGNRFLVAASRKYLIENKLLANRDVGPMFTVGQMTTIAWLADEVPFETTRVSKELVANCYRASTPSTGWDEAFWEALNKGGSNDIKNRLDNAIFVDGARRIAMDETFGQASLINKLDMASVLQKAEEQASRMENSARAAGEASGRIYSQQMSIKRARERCSNWAHTIVRTFIWIIFITAIISFGLSLIPLDQINFKLGITGRIITGIMSILSLLEIFKIGRVHRLFQVLEKKISASLYTTLYGQTLEFEADNSQET